MTNFLFDGPLRKRRRVYGRLASRARTSGTCAIATAGFLVACLALRPQVRAREAPKSDSEQVTDLRALEDAAAKNYPSLRAAKAAIETAEARLMEATWSPFFQFNVTGAMGLSPEVRGSPIFSPDPQVPLTNAWKPVYRIGVDGVVPLWTFGKLSAAREAARAGVRAARSDQDKSFIQVRYDVRRAYYALQMALDVQQMLNEGTSKLEAAVAQLRKRIDSGEGEANENDLYRLASTLAEVKARTSEARRLRASSEQALLILTGLPKVSVPDCALAPLPFRAKPLPTYVKLAYLNRPDARLLQAGIDARRAGLKASIAGYYPDIAAALGASRSYGPGITDQTNPFIIDQANYTALSAGLVARWSLDVPGDIARHRQARNNLEQTKAQVEEARRGIRLEVSTLYFQAIDAAGREQAWAKGRADARSWFIAATQAYQLGTAEPRDLVDSVRAYFTARASHLESIRDFNTTVAALSRATGAPILDTGRWEVACEDE